MLNVKPLSINQFDSEKMVKLLEYCRQKLDSEITVRLLDYFDENQLKIKKNGAMLMEIVSAIIWTIQ